MENKIELIDSRIEHLIDKFVDEYPKSYITDIMDDIISDLNTNDYIIQLCLQIWELTPSSILTLDELIDASILAQLSYNTHVLFISLPDMCDYSTYQFQLNQLQLSIIWLTSFIIQESTDMIFRWQKKDLSKRDKNLLKEIGIYYRDKIIARHRNLNYEKLSEHLIERRKQIGDKLLLLDNEFYREILYFFNCVCLTKNRKIPSYQQQILDNVNLESYYFKIHPTMIGRKKSKHKLNSSKIMTDQLMIKYRELYDIYYKKRNTGVPFE